MGGRLLPSVRRGSGGPALRANGHPCLGSITNCNCLQGPLLPVLGGLGLRFSDLRALALMVRPVGPKNCALHEEDLSRWPIRS